MQLLGRERTSLGLIGNRRNNYATDTDAKFPINYLNI